MQQPLLSILICTLPKRKRQFDQLCETLNDQIALCDATGKVEILTDDALMDPTGTKRNRLVLLSSGIFVVHFDDDDTPRPRYTPAIVGAIESCPDADCIGINGIYTVNGGVPKRWEISKEFGSWYETPDAYYRTPNHISPVNREIALACPFPDITQGEDIAYSMAILPYLKKEVRVLEDLYHYDKRQ